MGNNRGAKSGPRARAAVLLLAAATACLAASCDEEELQYLLQQAPGQAELLMGRVPFERMLKDPDLDPAVRDQLEFVLEVKRYGVEKIGLTSNKNYEVYKEVDRDAVVWNLTAAEPLSMTPLTWDFPVVGKVPYLGFFDQKDADQKAAELSLQGHDVYLRTAGAYSMLGIVADPLYSTLLKMSDADLANLVLHEMTHGTVFIKGQMEFNENLALFVGNQGSYNYLRARFGADSPQARYAVDSNEDDKLFGREIMKLYNELDVMYQTDIPDDQKRLKKALIIAAHKKHFRDDVIPLMKTRQYDKWPDKDINNATVISRVVYFHDLTLYEDIYRAKDSDLKAEVDFFKGVMAMKGVNPEEYAKDWLTKKDSG
ncbi:MAG TPA: aminopeptidase [bacterium]|nr:aminopeptidase [bacterium]